MITLSLFPLSQPESCLRKPGVRRGVFLPRNRLFIVPSHFYQNHRGDGELDASKRTRVAALPWATAARRRGAAAPRRPRRPPPRPPRALLPPSSNRTHSASSSSLVAEILQGKEKLLTI